ncbi:unnamed protein product [Durusdinium trenchii]|uniref:Uncharacterized protein n=1 Tax=Durusdinium trenchii TaxID=1381693 RepID=A0ABP0HZX2_9DINO
MVKVTLEEFICGPWLEEHGVFRAQLLQQLLVVNDVIEDWPRVLSACCGESRCHEAILEAVKKGCTGAEKWAEAHTQEPSLLLSFRLRLAVQSQSRPPPALLAEAEAALLRGEMLAPEALSSLDARSLWPRLVEQGALLPAAALLNCSGTESFEESEQVTSLIASNLLGPSAHARAALALLTALRPLSPPELLAALLQRQPLHLLESLPLPDEEPVDLQFAAAQLALRHGDRRVAGSVLRRLEKSRWMPEVVQAAVSGPIWVKEGSMAAAREEPWTQTWWAQEAANETNGSLEQLGVLMNARPWTRGSSHHTLADLLRGWLAASSAQARYGGDADAAARAANAALRQLRLELPELPELVRSVAESFAALQKEAAEQCPLLLEMAACGLEVPGLEELLKRCRRTELKELVTADGLSTHQRQRRAAGLGRDAATALWAVKHLGAEVELQDGGFELVFSGQRCGYISWNDARKGRTRVRFGLCFAWWRRTRNAVRGKGTPGKSP